MTIRRDWLDQIQEEIIEPDYPLVDPHHHFWRTGRFGRYMLEELWRDTSSGHRIERTVFIECAAEYRTDGPVHLRPVGETEFVAELAAASAQNHTGQARVAGIVGFADLTLGDAVEEVLNAHIVAGQGLFRGIRHQGTWHASAEVPNSRINPPPDLFEQPAYQAGLRRLGAMGLSFESWNYHTQLPQVMGLAKAAPATTIVLNHLGGPIGIGPYAGRCAEVFTEWQKSIQELSQYPNVVVKLGGIAMEVNGYGWHERALPPTSAELVAAQRPWHLHAIDCFGPDRCMFESNYPVEGISVPYHVLWNTFKLIAADFSPTEKAALLGGTATRVYRLA
ncbi:MAG: amidohydrolase family protein [Caldilineaceae bacterium]